LAIERKWGLICGKSVNVGHVGMLLQEGHIAAAPWDRDQADILQGTASNATSDDL